MGQELRQIRGNAERRWAALFGSNGASFFLSRGSDRHILSPLRFFVAVRSTRLNRSRQLEALPQLSKSGAVPFSLLCDTIQRSAGTDGNDSIRGRCGPCESGKRLVGYRDGSCVFWPVELSELWVEVEVRCCCWAAVTRLSSQRENDWTTMLCICGSNLCGSNLAPHNVWRSFFIR